MLDRFLVKLNDFGNDVQLTSCYLLMPAEYRQMQEAKLVSKYASAKYFYCQSLCVLLVWCFWEHFSLMHGGLSLLLLVARKRNVLPFPVLCFFLISSDPSINGAVNYK